MSVGNLRVIDTIWCSGAADTIGIVLAEDTVTGRVNVYIGRGLGVDEKTDQDIIMGHGCKIEYADRFIELFRKVKS